MKNNSNSSSNFQAEDTASLIQDIRNLFYFRKKIGRIFYPDSPAINHFLSNQYSLDNNISKKAILSRLSHGTHKRHSEKNAGKVHIVEKDTGSQRIKQLELIQNEINSCSLCSLVKNRHGIISGLGTVNAKLMIIGDWSVQVNEFNPELQFGKQEDEMLWNMIKAIGLEKQDVYVSNCIKCCPKNNIIPDNKSEQCCHTYIEREIAAVNPKIICAMGDAATRLLIASTLPFIRIRGRLHPLKSNSSSSIKIMPTYHPRFLLEHPEMKKTAWIDLQTVQKTLKTAT